MCISIFKANILTGILLEADMSRISFPPTWGGGTLPGDNLKSLHCFKNSLKPTNIYELFQNSNIICKKA